MTPIQKGEVISRQNGEAVITNNGKLTGLMLDISDNNFDLVFIKDSDEIGVETIESVFDSTFTNYGASWQDEKDKKTANPFMTKIQACQ